MVGVVFLFLVTSQACATQAPGQGECPVGDPTCGMSTMLLQTKHAKLLSSTAVARTVGGSQTVLGGLTQVVAKAYYINLESSVERRTTMEAQLASLRNATGLPFQRFPGINGSTDPWAQAHVGASLENPFVTDYMRSSINGTLGCWRSHTGLWKSILAQETGQHSQGQHSQGPPYSLIFEDDADVRPDVWSTLASRLEGLPNDHDMVLLGWTHSSRESDVVGAGVYRANAPFSVQNETGSWHFYGGAHAYLVRHQSLARMIALEEDRAIRSNATPAFEFHYEDGDASMFRTWSIDADTNYGVSGIHKYAVFPQMVNLSEERASASNINNVVGN